MLIVNIKLQNKCSASESTVIPGNFISLPKTETVSLSFLCHSTSSLSTALGDKAYNTTTLLRDKLPKHQGVFLAECTAFFNPITV